MTQPWVPAPNPGGRNREFIRKVIAQWIYDAAIPGVGSVYPGLPLEQMFDVGQAGSLYRANIGVHVSSSTKNFKVLTGPSDAGGYFAHYDALLSLKHRCTDVQELDWWQAEDDHDRILDALEDRLRGEGRDLGRPDVVLQSAAWPSEGSIRDETDEPVYNNGVRDQWSRIFFTVSQYMQREP